MSNTRPQTEEKASVPWCIEFTRKDLLAASWGSKKGADLLYHFLHRASWEKKNKHENETLKQIMFQESTPKALEKSGCSLGTFHTFLKLFVSVGYLDSAPYSGEYMVHTEKILAAFKNPPEKPVKEGEEPRQSRQKCFNLKDCNFVTLPAEDYKLLLELKEECFNLKEMFQRCFNFGPKLKQFFQSLKQNPTIYAALGAELEALFNPLDMILENDSNALRKEREESNIADSSLFDSAIASSAPALSAEVEIVPLVSVAPEQVILPIIPETPIPTEISYSLPPSTPTAVEALPEVAKAVDAVSVAEDYTKHVQEDSTEKPGKPARTRRARSVEPAKPTGPMLTEEGQRVLDAWSSLFKSPVKAGPKTIEAANTLYAQLLPWAQEELDCSLAELLASIKGWMFEVDKRGFYARGIGLTDVARDFEKWQSARQRQTSAQKTGTQKAAAPKDPETTVVVWTHFPSHSGTALDHWYLYELMPMAEALKYGWNEDAIVPSDRNAIKTRLKAKTDGRRTLTKEQQAEYDQYMAVA